MCVYVLSAQHTVKLDPRCIDPSIQSIHSNYRTFNEEGLSNNKIRYKMLPKIVSFRYKNYGVVNKTNVLQYAKHAA